MACLTRCVRSRRNSGSSGVEPERCSHEDSEQKRPGGSLMVAKPRVRPCCRRSSRDSRARSARECADRAGSADRRGRARGSPRLASRRRAAGSIARAISAFGRMASAGDPAVADGVVRDSRSRCTRSAREKPSGRARSASVGERSAALFVTVSGGQAQPAFRNPWTTERLELDREAASAE